MAELATSLTATEAERLDQAEALVRGFCRWHIAPSREEQTLTVRTRGQRDIFLPSLYVTAIDSVTEDGADLIATDYEWIAPSSILRRSDGALWGLDAEVVVTFTHGYADVPAEVTAVVQAVAQRAIQNPGSVLREQAGPFGASWSLTGPNQSGSLALLDSEKDALRPYRIPVVA